MQVCGPFLVIGPLSTLANWVAEIKRMTPDLPVILYHGAKEERRMMWRKISKELRVTGKCPIVVTSYEISMNDRTSFQRVNWKYMIIDEGHRLKNKDCKLIAELRQLKTANRLLLTGTPLQNNLVELWSLLHFVLPEVFNDVESFLQWFDFEAAMGNADAAEKLVKEEEESSIITKLHSILDPFLLRRLKQDVELGLPSKQEYIVYVPMTTSQRKYYDSVRDKTIRSVIEREDSDRLSTSDVSRNLNNVVMQLRKCCNHPYLFQPKEDAFGNFLLDEELVEQAGKFKLLDRMLPKLKANGHKVLLFCQMTKMMDLVEDYMELRNWGCCRLDGSIPYLERMQAIEDFKTKEDKFVFILSTRAGGLGINLACADTVIIYDTDWNPQADLQAQDRCHRIGQTKPVTVLRLVTTASVEVNILDRANDKRKLEQMVIHKGRFKTGFSEEQQRRTVTPEELASMLKARIEEESGGDEAEISDKDLDSVLLERKELDGPKGPGWRRMEAVSGSWIV